MDSKRVAVLGSNGHLGSIIVDYLSTKDYQVYPINRNNLNLNDYNAVKDWLISSNIDVIINCATAGGKLTVKDVIYEDVQNNISLFLNFYNNSQHLGKFINIGSGAEFDLKKNIDLAKEEDILQAYPEESYAYSKNVISRLVLEKDNFYTLRLFGCFDPREPEFRLFKKFLYSERFELVDRKFDYISSRDFCKILDYYINTKDLPKDINCVYQDKLYLSQILDKFDSKGLNIIGKNNLNYTGNGDKLASLGILLDGLDQGIKDYIN